MEGSTLQCSHHMSWMVDLTYEQMCDRMVDRKRLIFRYMLFIVSQSYLFTPWILT